MFRESLPSDPDMDEDEDDEDILSVTDFSMEVEFREFQHKLDE